MSDLLVTCISSLSLHAYVQASTSSLHEAASKQSKELVSLYLEHGVDINLLDESGRLPLHSALQSAQQSTTFIVFLLEHGADAHAVTPSNFGALHYALYNMVHTHHSFSF
jgi:ankyrin repeat protein